MKFIDAEFHKFSRQMLDNDITDILDLTMLTADDKFGVRVVVDLVPDGRNIPVTEGNKVQYAELITERIVKFTEEQVKPLREGLFEIVPEDLLMMFDERELEMLISGNSEIDVDDWETNTDYIGYSNTDEIIRWFWKLVGSWNEEKKSRLLQFTTGTSRISVNGFKDLQGSDGPRRFTIEKAGDVNYLPKANTCFNALILPPYKSFWQLENKWTLAVEQTMGFGQE